LNTWVYFANPDKLNLEKAKVEPRRAKSIQDLPGFDLKELQEFTTYPDF
jgi:hypothetical protein